MKKSILGLILLSLIPQLSAASERHFSFSYESDILQYGQKELETYSSYRFGREAYFSALDQRLEFELGLGSGVQTSLYLNFTQEMADDGTGNIHNDFLADGISNEWKFKLSDNLTDGLGLGLYVETGFKPDELELETKIILDKRMGPWLWTLNLTNEPELHFEDNTMGFSLNPSLGFGGFLVDNRLFFGIEAQNRNFWYNTSLPITSSYFSAGPVLAYQSEDWWVTLAYLPQLVNFLGPKLDLTNGERNQVVLGFSIALNSHQTSDQKALSLPTENDIERLTKSNTKMILPDLLTGRELYTRNCQKCHQPHMPAEYSAENWEKIMMKMRVKSRLDADSADLILGFLKAFADKD